MLLDEGSRFAIKGATLVHLSNYLIVHDQDFDFFNSLQASEPILNQYYLFTAEPIMNESYSKDLRQNHTIMNYTAFNLKVCLRGNLNQVQSDGVGSKMNIEIDPLILCGH